MGRTLTSYKLQQAYRKNKYLKRRLRSVGVVKRYMESIPAGNVQSARHGLFGADWAQATPDQKRARRALRFYGQGDYKSVLKYGSRGLGALAGGAMGYMQGGLQGAGAGLSSGWEQGANFSRFMGWGDYSANQIVHGGGNSQQQISVNQTDLSGDIYVARTEFVSNVVVTGTAGGSSGFENRSFSLNPGIGGAFPWLSQIATCFTLYDFEGLMFQYKPLFSEDAGSSNNLGKVIMATDYDPTSSPFLTSVQMENYDYANSSKPSCGMVHGVETANRQQVVNMMYVRSGAVSRDLTFYDLGTFQLATEGVPLPAASTSQIIGELWVTYRVKLSRAEIYSALLANNIQQCYLGGTSSAAALYTATTTVKSTNTLALTVSNVSATALTVSFPVSVSLGYYQVVLQFLAGGTPFTTQSGNNCSDLVNCQFYRPGFELPGTTSIVVNGPKTTYTGTTANDGIVMIQWVYVNSPGLNQASFRFNVSGALSATTTWRLWATQQPQNPSTILT